MSSARATVAKLALELRETRLLHRQARRHFVAAVLLQQVLHSVERVDQRKPFDAAAAALPQARRRRTRPPASADGAMRISREATMPSTPGCQPARADHDGRARAAAPPSSASSWACASSSVRCSTACRSRFCASSAAASSRARFSSVGQQQFQRGLRGAEPAGGVEAWPEAKADVDRPHRRLHAGHFHQRAQPRPERARHLQAAPAHEDAVFLHQRHEVGHRAERDEVERIRAGRTRAAAAA